MMSAMTTFSKPIISLSVVVPPAQGAEEQVEGGQEPANGCELPVHGPQAQVSGRGSLHHKLSDLPLA